MRTVRLAQPQEQAQGTAHRAKRFVFGAKCQDYTIRTRTLLILSFFVDKSTASGIRYETNSLTQLLRDDTI